MGSPRYAPVPVCDTELLRELRCGSVRLTESRHRAASTIACHAHRRATLTMLVQGSFEESYAARRDIVCVAPAVHVRPAGEPHRDRMGTAGAVNLVLELDDHRLEQVRRHSGLFDDVRALCDVELLAVARRLHREMVIDDEATALAVEGLAMEMLARAMRAASRGLDRPSPWLDRVRDRLHDCFLDHRPSLDELAEVAGVHPVHLARAFRHVHGVSPGEYLRRLRVDWAADELRTTTRPIAEIAADAGFADQSHLTRVFKASRGVPPGAWRRGLHRSRH
ncbi:MAG: AraC family transcriptional regulator [Acidobacteriota bacterium]